MANKVYTWYLEPLDSLTNAIIAGELPEENFAKRIIEGDASPHSLWACPSWFVTSLWRSRSHLGIKFKIFSRVGQGKIRDCTFLYRKKQKKQKQKQKTAA